MWKRRTQWFGQRFAQRVWVMDFNRHDANVVRHRQTEVVPESNGFPHTQKMRRMNRQSFDAVDVEQMDCSRRHETCHDRVNNDRMCVSDKEIQESNSHFGCFPHMNGRVTGEVFGQRPCDAQSYRIIPQYIIPKPQEQNSGGARWATIFDVRLHGVWMSEKGDGNEKARLRDCHGLDLGRQVRARPGAVSNTNPGAIPQPARVCDRRFSARLANAPGANALRIQGRGRKRGTPFQPCSADLL